MYIYEQPDWPQFRWDPELVHGVVSEVRFAQGRLLGRVQSLGFEAQRQATADAVAGEATETSAIEGEMLDAAQVRSSVARRLGLDAAGLAEPDRRVDGVVAMTLDATAGWDRPLTSERLFEWHRLLFPDGRSGSRAITVGAWRPREVDPMQVVSGPIGRERVHFQAPSAARLPEEMDRFLAWFERSGGMQSVVRTALAHLWFVTVHPFEDGNGRIARAIADLSLARADRWPGRFYSMSAQIAAERKNYYEHLERTQRGGLDVTPWVEWFAACLGRAIARSDRALDGVARRTTFWQRVAGVSISERQRKVLGRLLENFEGKLTTKKYAALAKCSADTALRDIQDLMDKGVLAPSSGGGRSTSYVLTA